MPEIVVPLSDHEEREFYGVVSEVIARTGLQPSDLGLDDLPAFNAFVERLLRQLTAQADRRMHKTYLPDEVDPGLDLILDNVAADGLREMVATRQSPIVSLEDLTVSTMHAKFWTPEALEELKLYARGGGMRSMRMRGDIAGAGRRDVFAALLNDEE